MELFDFVRIARTAVSTTRRVVTASIVGIGNVGDDASAERVDNCEVAQPLGLFARPVLTTLTEAVIVRLADRPFILAMLDKGRPAQAVEEGEVRLYGPGSSNAAAVIRIRADGSIEITATNNTNVSLNVGGTGDVVLDGGSLKVARVTDTATAGVTMTTWIAAVSTFINGLAPGTVVPPTDFGVIASSGGATHVKA